MIIGKIASGLNLVDLTPQFGGKKMTEVTGGYASDLLSDVLAHAPSGGVLVTIQAHMNVVAVASHAGLAAVIFASSKRPSDMVIAKAVEQGIQLFASSEPTFTVVGRLWELGLRGPEV